MDDQPPQRGAALAGGADGREQDGADRHVEVGGRRDDHRVVAAELENGAPEPGGDLRPDRRAHPGRAGRRDDRHVPRGDQRLADRRAADDDLRQPVRRVGPKRFEARSKTFIAASALSGVLSDGFQITGSPQTSASAAFHDQTATGKLKAEMTAHGPIGCQVSIMRWPGRSEAMVEAVDLARQADGEIADVDHFLHFAETLGDDLAGFEGDHRAERLLGGAQFLAEQADEFAPARRRDVAPGGEGAFARATTAGMSESVVSRHAGDLRAVDRRAHDERAAAEIRRAKPARAKNVLAGHGSRPSFCGQPCRARGSGPAAFGPAGSPHCPRESGVRGDGAGA